MHSQAQLKALFEPRSVAVVGASRSPRKLGHVILSNLIRAGYKGTLLPVNPEADEVLGIPALPDVCALPEGVDMAVICLPAAKVLDAVRGLAARKARSAVVISAGFKETGRQGFRLEEALAREARAGGMLLLGPNSLGFINNDLAINAGFGPEAPLAGSVSFFSQSGAMCVAVQDYADGWGLGFSKFISLGNMAVLDEAAALAYLGDDPATRVILGYCESMTDGGEFLRVARRVAAAKPVVMIKAGTTPAGAMAVASHTGTMAGSEAAFAAAFRQAGIIQADSVESLFDLARCFAGQPLPQGPNLAVVTNSGGPGILAADACENSHLQLVRPSPATLEALRQFLPPFASLYNPIDIIGDADAERYSRTVAAVLGDENVHSALVLLTPTSSIAPQVRKVAAGVIEAARGGNKPVACCFMGGPTVAPAAEMLRKAGTPCYDFPEPAIRSLEAMYLHLQRARRPETAEAPFSGDREAARKVLDKALQGGLTELVEFQAQAVAQAYGLPLPATVLARTSDEAVAAAEAMGYPVALKVASPMIARKHEVGGVALDLPDAQAVRRAFLSVTSRSARRAKDAYILGCLVQRMGPPGAREAAVSFIRDPQFGPLVRFGLAGAASEVLRDVSCRLAPLTPADAQEMLREIRAAPLLRGVRGQKPVSLKAVEDILLAVSRLALDFPEIKEAEFDPVLMGEESAWVADLRLTIGRQG